MDLPKKMIRINKNLERWVDTNQYVKYLLWPYKSATNRK